MWKQCRKHLCHAKGITLSIWYCASGMSEIRGKSQGYTILQSLENSKCICMDQRGLSWIRRCFCLTGSEQNPPSKGLYLGLQRSSNGLGHHLLAYACTIVPSCTLMPGVSGHGTADDTYCLMVILSWTELRSLSCNDLCTWRKHPSWRCERI